MFSNFNALAISADKHFLHNFIAEILRLNKAKLVLSNCKHLSNIKQIQRKKWYCEYGETHLTKII